MPTTCSSCGAPLPDAGVCPACAGNGTLEQAISAGEPRVPPAQSAPAETSTAEVDIKHRATAAGCLLALLSAAAIFGSAVPIVTWRDEETGLPLPRSLAIALPVLAGAICYGIGAGICKLLGIATVQQASSKSDADSNGTPRAPV